MNRITVPLLTLGLSLAPTLCWAADPNADRARVIAKIKKLGGTVTLDENSPGEPVIEVNLMYARVTSAELANLKGLPKLQSLNIMYALATRAGLEHFKRLPNLQTLNLMDTQVTDAGLEHSQRIAQSQVANLTQTKVTDAGLVHLKGLT